MVLIFIFDNFSKDLCVDRQIFYIFFVAFWDQNLNLKDPASQKTFIDFCTKKNILMNKLFYSVSKRVGEA